MAFHRGSQDLLLAIPFVAQVLTLHFHTKTKSILLYKIIATLKNYPCTVSNMNWFAILEGILPTL